MSWEGQTYAADNDSILLRGAVLRNTLWCYGVVIFAGNDSKLMQNSGKTKFKRTSIDRLLNFIILGVICFSSSDWSLDKTSPGSTEEHLTLFPFEYTCNFKIKKGPCN